MCYHGFMTNLPKNPKPHFEKLEFPRVNREAKLMSKKDLDKGLKIIEENRKIEEEIRRKCNGYSS